MSAKVDVVYTLANLSKHRDDFELRYSLRSLAQQDWVGEIFLLGHCPKWVKDVYHAPVSDPFPAVKDANIIRKVLHACNLVEVSDQFVVNSDDHYILHPIPLTGLGPWLENPSQLPESYRKLRSSTWHRRLVETVTYAKKHGFPDWVLECHIPYLVDKKKYQDVMSNLPFHTGNGLLTHIYYNLTIPPKTPPLKENLRKTTRLKKAMTEVELQKAIKGRTFLNHNNAGLCPALKKWMEERFPEPSRWEDA